MRIIAVGGSEKGAGKTTTAEFLLKYLPGYGALKVTVCAGACPRPDPCGVCARLKTPYALIEEEEVLGTPGTDTARLLAAGAAKVSWLQATEKGLNAGITAALASFTGLPGIVTEGNHFIAAAHPSLSLLVLPAGNTPHFKPSATEILSKVTAVLLNRRGTENSQDFLALLSLLPPQLRHKPLFLIEPRQADSLDNELFLSYLQNH